MNFSGKYPEFVRLRGTCYAIRALGETYVMVSKYSNRWWTHSTRALISVKVIIDFLAEYGE